MLTIVYVCVCVCIDAYMQICFLKNDTALNFGLRLQGVSWVNGGTESDPHGPSIHFARWFYLSLSKLSFTSHRISDAPIHTHTHTRTYTQIIPCFCASFQSCYGSVLMSITLNSLHWEARRQQWEEEMKKGKTSVEYK